ncbi:hypothetical protein Isop_1607 [Isosphaera pallida ATCC 43644]|uniref:Uncharacterized protein n=1 Tax=Isosphaera pallida (strain ATCC 43644 / DSM 9630 / IS1B) TaxID=575540 RepID=E8QZQ5_ISOPI|nr:hypothetical protein [Isosphaera pallida]ADV62191.1 hypothetical protein Isop_1607 [Isosphaera pallida ATCC 43644]
MTKPSGESDAARSSGPQSHQASFGTAPSALAETAWTEPEHRSLVLETVVSPFHCLYQDALFFHAESQLRQTRSELEASRLARAAFVLYLSAAEALVHQAAVELGRPELWPMVADPSRPLPLAECWRLLPAIVAESPAANHRFDPTAPPWPQFSELLALRTAWAYPGPPPARRAYYRSRPDRPDEFEPMEPHEIPESLEIPADRLRLPKTGLPRDPYALRPHHLDTARGVLDAAIDALDRRLGGALTERRRHRAEPTRLIVPHDPPTQGSPL